ncbi:exocyst complex component EXO84A-like protein, partial [Tanacetum coccineum]
MTDSEFADKKAKGLCYRCVEKFLPGHRCPEKALQLLLVDDDEDEEIEGGMTRNTLHLEDKILFLELRKVEELAEDNIVEFDWLVSLLTEVVETTFDWISKNGEKWTIHDNEGITDQQIYCISKNGGYLTANMVNSLTYLISRMESAIVSTGFDLNRYAVDYEKVTNSAMEAIKKLEALEEQ